MEPGEDRGEQCGLTWKDEKESGGLWTETGKTDTEMNREMDRGMNRKPVGKPAGRKGG